MSDKTFALVTFALLCVLCLAMVLMLAIILFRRRRGAAIMRGMTAFYILTMVGAFLSALTQYWHAFGAPPRHAALPYVVQGGTLCVYGVAFWIARRPLGQNIAQFVQASGGTAWSALASALLHPSLFLNHLHSRMQAANTELPPS